MGRAEEPANLVAPAPDFSFQGAPAPGFFSSGSCSGSKEPKTPGSDRLPSPVYGSIVIQIYASRVYSFFLINL